MKRSTSVRLSDQARELLVKLAEQMGVSQTAVLEIAIRDLALSKGIVRAQVKEG